MAQRNPLNDRNQTKLAGQTRRSASSAVPARKAATTIITPTASKKTANSKTASPKSSRFRFRNNKALDPTVKLTDEQKQRLAANANSASSAGNATNATKATATTTVKRPSATPNTPEYKKFRRIYWVLIIIGVVSVAISFVSQQLNYEGALWMVAMGLAYAVVIAAIVVDIAKVRPIVKRYQAAQGPGANMSPKQQKHKASTLGFSPSITNVNETNADAVAVLGKTNKRKSSISKTVAKKRVTKTRV